MHESVEYCSTVKSVTRYLYHERLYVVFVQKKQLLERELPGDIRIKDLLKEAEERIFEFTEVVKNYGSEVEKLTESMKGLCVTYHTRKLGIDLCQH